MTVVSHLINPGAVEYSSILAIILCVFIAHYVHLHNANKKRSETADDVPPTNEGRKDIQTSVRNATSVRPEQTFRLLVNIPGFLARIMSLGSAQKQSSPV